MGPDVLVQLVLQVGLAAALVIYFVWQGGKREEKYEERLQSIQDFTQETLVTLVTNSTEASNKLTSSSSASTDACKEHTVAINRLSESLDTICKGDKCGYSNTSSR